MTDERTCIRCGLPAEGECSPAEGPACPVDVRLSGVGHVWSVVCAPCTSPMDLVLYYLHYYFCQSKGRQECDFPDDKPMAREIVIYIQRCVREGLYENFGHVDFYPVVQTWLRGCSDRLPASVRDLSSEIFERPHELVDGDPLTIIAFEMVLGH